MFNILIVIFTGAILIFAFLQLSYKLKAIPKEIGESPYEVIATIQQGEKALIFLDLASKWALSQAVYDVQSGLGLESTCGIYYGFPEQPGRVI